MRCGVRALKEPFVSRIRAILARYLRQNQAAVPGEAELNEIADRMWDLINLRGLPPPLAEGELGTPGELSAAEVAPMLDRVLAGCETRAALVDPVRQLIKACFHREFTICRDSYREVSGDGVCRRQTLTKALARVSGSHCVDCPYWTALSPLDHAEKLEAAWVGDSRDFVEHRDIFLPEDFRELRQWIHAAARARGRDRE